MYICEEEEHIFFIYDAYPFTRGIGLEKTLAKLGYKLTWQSPNKIIGIINENVFEIIKKQNKNEELLLIRPDNIKKKLKANFHKCIILILNNAIKAYNLDKSKNYFFSNLPQSFITNINISKNAEVMNTKFKDLLLTNEKNHKIIEYLDNNKYLSEKIKWNIIKDMTYEQLLGAYFKSAEFEKSICDLKEKSGKRKKIVDSSYIKSYINIALSYIDFYSSPNQQEEISQDIQDISSNMNLMDRYNWQIDSEDTINSPQENNTPIFNEPLFGGVNSIPDEDEMKIDDENEINNEKMNTSGISEELNDSFEEKNNKKMINYIINEQNKRYM